MDEETAKAEMHRLEKLFHELDENKDGRIDIRELTVGLKRMGYYHITEEQIEVGFLLPYAFSTTLFHDADANLPTCVSRSL